MIKTISIDANIIIRFLLNDHPRLSAKAKLIFQKAEKGLNKIYLDEIIVAEVIWTLSSFYKINKVDLVDRLEKLISQDWIINPRKNLILQSLDCYRSFNIDYIDCWIFIVSSQLGINLQTFDHDIKKLIRK